MWALLHSYNDAFGATRVRLDAQAIRRDPPQLDQQDTLVFHCVVPSDTHQVGFEARRFIPRAASTLAG